MKTFRLSLILLLLTSVAAIACAPTEDTLPEDEYPQAPEENEHSNEEDTDTSKTGSWPETQETTIMLEGMEESFTLHLFEDADSFITYVPEDLIPEVSDNDTTYTFYANFGNNKNEEVYLEIKLPYDITQGETLEHDGIQLTKVDDNQHIHSWSLAEYQNTDDNDYSIYASLGNHNGGKFIMITHYPVEFSDGFGPRAATIIEHFYWMDSDEYLVEQ
ncbi:hypothetical protein [Desertibacillus haloalkaliphilus]|uniref:hypothetical protein n=1 Tax=Desertibacillus haloalkaliphilus TaxID=1328930 RepID=UPI001C263FC2|nr:hypothetical protein [Desertibacillus haloalkaliphilus]MBU8905802.1 hypothetical protein [Desertibacillus haloalkaliphilus]